MWRVCLTAYNTGVTYLSASAFDEAIKKEQTRAKQLEDNYNEKIVEHSVSFPSWATMQQPRFKIVKDTEI